MIWPANLVSCALFNTLHSQQYAGIGNRGGISRERFFVFGFLASFSWCKLDTIHHLDFFNIRFLPDFIPGYLCKTHHPMIILHALMMPSISSPGAVVLFLGYLDSTRRYKCAISHDGFYARL